MSKGTLKRSIRIPDDLWDRAKAIAAERGENLSDIIRNALTKYVENKGEQ